MELLFVCVKIFLARILDVAIGTIRQSTMLKGKIFITALLAFLETFIWFLIAREALLIDINSILIPIFYSLGFATGTLIGTCLSKIFIKSQIGLQIIINAQDNKLLNALKARGYLVSVINLENDFAKEKKRMIFLEVNSRSLKKVENLIRKNNPESFLIISESKKVENGVVK